MTGKSMAPHLSFLRGVAMTVRTLGTTNGARAAQSWWEPAGSRRRFDRRDALSLTRVGEGDRHGCAAGTAQEAGSEIMERLRSQREQLRVQGVGP